MEKGMRVSVAFACLLALGCARETKERPVVAAPPRASADPLPLPETAFSGDGEEPRREDRDRFVPRRIGPRADEGGTHRWSGARIDLDVKGADIHDVLRLIADVGKVNIVVAGDVSGTITLKLAR